VKNSEIGFNCLAAFIHFGSVSRPVFSDFNVDAPEIAYSPQAGITQFTCSDGGAVP
jgi:hypothetical protein